VLAILAVSTGCAGGFPNPFAVAGPPAPQVLRPGATLEEVVAAVNANSARVQTYAANGATIKPQGMPGVPALSGGIMIERPARFRVYAGTALTGREIDLGSNEELLWMWMARSEPPAVYLWGRDQFAGSQAQQMLPVDPDWLPSALGLVEFAPHGRHELRLLPDQRLEVLSIVPGPGGIQTRVCVIDPVRAWVLQQHVYDASGSPVATAVASGHRYYPEYQVSLPQHIEVRVPPAQLALAIDVGQVLLNRALGDPGQLWVPPSGYPHVQMGSNGPGLAAQSGLPGSGAALPTNTEPPGDVLYVPRAPQERMTARPGELQQPVYRTPSGL